MSEPDLEISFSIPRRSEGKWAEILLRYVLATALYLKEGCVFPKGESGKNVLHSVNISLIAT